MRRSASYRVLHSIEPPANHMFLSDFWGPVSNFGIPVAAVMDTQKSPELYVVPLHRR